MMEASKVSLQLQSIEDSMEKLTANQGKVEWKPDVDKKVDELRDAMLNSGRWTCSVFMGKFPTAS